MWPRPLGTGDPPGEPACLLLFLPSTSVFSSQPQRLCSAAGPTDRGTAVVPQGPRRSGRERRASSGKGRGTCSVSPAPSGPAHSPLDVGVILFQEVIVLPPVLKNVFNETAWGPHGDKSVLSCWKPTPSPSPPFLKALGLRNFCTSHATISPQPMPLTSLQSGHGTSTALRADPGEKTTPGSRGGRAQEAPGEKDTGAPDPHLSLQEGGLIAPPSHSLPAGP